jgi:hypothetical protein
MSSKHEHVCIQCGATISWGNLKVHEDWHAGTAEQTELLRQAVEDLIDAVYGGDVVNGRAARDMWRAAWNKESLVDSEE